MLYTEEYRTLVKGLLPAFIAVMIGFLLVGIIQKVKYGHAVETLDPAVLADFEDVTGHFSFSEDQPTLLVYFNPDCDHCHYEARAIRDSLDRFRQVNVVLTGAEPAEQLKRFGEAYDLIDQPNVHILHDAKGVFHQYFGKHSVPSIYIYDRKRELRQHFRGETKVEAILKYFD